MRIPTNSGYITVVDGVDYEVEAGQFFGIAGESGSGKTMSMMALTRLAPRGTKIEGKAYLEGRNLLDMSTNDIRRIRGREMAIVFQDPTTCFHPMLRIGTQLTEHARYHLNLSRAAAAGLATKLLTEVRIPDPAAAMNAYPHQFSGGMRQRIAIAMALICEPKILIADEPTTGLDVTVQAGILRLLSRLRDSHNLSIILITHDLGVMSAVADHLSIFYAGRVVESGSARDVLRTPRHPYTAALLASLPHPEAPEGTRLVPIRGAPPTPYRRPSGCAFHPRCPYAIASCKSADQVLSPVEGRVGQRIACSVDPYGDQ